MRTRGAPSAQTGQRETVLNRGWGFMHPAVKQLSTQTVSSLFRILMILLANNFSTDGHSLGQLMKFCGHRNPKTIVGYYLDDMSNVDGAAAYLGLEPRRDLTQDFRSASMRRNPDLRHSFPAKNLDQLKQRRDFTVLCEQINTLSAKIIDATLEEVRKELNLQRRYVYDQRQKLIDEDLANYRKTQQRVCTT